MDLADAIDDADRHGATSPRQQSIVHRARAIRRAFSRTGLIAQIDEDTGYQRIRDEDALAKILEHFLSEELQPWVRTFPYEFYEELYRLRNWGDPDPNGQMPDAVGRYTVDLVYSRLAPGVYEEVTARTPRLQGGELKWRLHRWFNSEHGHKKLRDTITGVVAIMKSSSDWIDFKKRLPKAYPKYGDPNQLQLDLEQKWQRSLDL